MVMAYFQQRNDKKTHAIIEVLILRHFLKGATLIKATPQGYSIIDPLKMNKIVYISMCNLEKLKAFQLRHQVIKLLKGSFFLKMMDILFLATRLTNDWIIAHNIFIPRAILIVIIDNAASAAYGTSA